MASFPLQTNSVSECIQALKKIQGSPEFRDLYEEFFVKAKSGDKNTWSLLYQIMRDADSGKLGWALHRDILASTVSLLTRIGDSQSYRLLINYIKTMDRTVPVGALELISDLLPTFEELDPEEILKIASQKDDIRSAIGLIVLSKLVIENRLDEKERARLKILLQDYKNHKYYLSDIVESTLQFLEAQEKGSGLLESEDLDKIFG
jgi:hypothetical protein